MARLLASQGHTERSLMIYEELLARNSTDAELACEVEALRKGEPPEPGLVLPAPGGLPQVSLPNAADRIDCRASAGEGLCLSWKVTPEGMARARAVLGQPGELAVRLVIIAPDAERVVRTDITEHGPVHEDGEWLAPRSEGRCFAAVGLRAEDRFVSITHVRA
jgi:hypothetical protein